MKIGGLICGSGIGQIVTDVRIANAILRRAAKKNKLHPAFRLYLFQGYIACDMVKDNDLSYDEYWTERNKTQFSNVEYKGKKYMSKYFDGCFCPFVVEQI